MNLQSFFLISLTAINLMSCSKNKNTPLTTTIQGQVRTFGTEEPIRHGPVRVQLLEKEESSHWGSGDVYHVRFDTMTDQDKKYSFEFELKTDREYFVGVDRETVTQAYYYRPSYSSNGNPNHRINQRGGTATTNYYLTAKGWIKFHFFNENPQPSDRFAYSAGSGAYEEIYGDVDIFRTIVFAGNTEKSIAIGVTQNGIDTTWRQYFFVPAFDTTDIQIKF